MRLKAGILLLLAMLTAPLAGCEMSCRADSDNDVEDAIEEIGDAVEDVTDENDE